MDHSDGDADTAIDNTQGYPRFEDLKVTTMTMVGEFSGQIIDISDLFFFLPVNRIIVDFPLRKVKKIKLPFPGKPGVVITVNYNGLVRGIFRGFTKGKWKNSIMVDVSTSEKIVNLKISRENIQMCGVKNFEMGKEANHIMLDYINSIQEELDFIHTHLNEAYWVRNVFVDVCQGPVVERKFRLNDREEKIGIVLSEPCYLYTPLYINPPSPLIRPEGVIQLSPADAQKDMIMWNQLKTRIRSSGYEQDTLKRIAKFFSDQMVDIFCYDYAIMKLDFIFSKRYIITQRLQFERQRVGMVKNGFQLGFRTKQWELSQLLGEVPNYYVTYSNDVTSKITVEVPYELDPEISKRRRSKAPTKHTFSIQQTGQSTHSGPGGEEMEREYYRFIRTVLGFREQVEFLPT